MSCTLIAYARVGLDYRSRCSLSTSSGLSPMSSPYSSRWTWGKTPPPSSPSTHRIAPLSVTTLLWPHNSPVLHARLSRFGTPLSLGPLRFPRVAQQATITSTPRHHSREGASHRTGSRTASETQWDHQPVFRLYGVSTVGDAAGAVAGRLGHVQIPVGCQFCRHASHP